MQQLMNQLYAGNNLTFEQAQQLFTQLLSGEADDIQITAALVALKMKGEVATEVAGLVKSLRDVAVPFNKPEGLYADCCGTGGDGLNTFNVSTASAFVAAECGLPMIKHGNRSASSRYGSADLIEALGIDLAGSAEQSKACFDLTNYCFMFAPAYHPLVAHVMPVRKQLATATIFNLAGPLANPAAPPVQLMGVCREELCLPLAEVLLQLDCDRGLVVYGGGLDEVALHDETTAVMVENGQLRHLTITPEEAGLERRPVSAIQLKEDDDPVEIFQAVIEGKGSAAMTDMVALNTGTLLWLSGLQSSIKDGTKIAKQVLRDGAVAQKITSIQDFYRG